MLPKGRPLSHTHTHTTHTHSYLVSCIPAGLSVPNNDLHSCRFSCRADQTFPKNSLVLIAGKIRFACYFSLLGSIRGNGVVVGGDPQAHRLVFDLEVYSTITFPFNKYKFTELTVTMLKKRLRLAWCNCFAASSWLT